MTYISRHFLTSPLHDSGLLWSLCHREGIAATNTPSVYVEALANRQDLFDTCAVRGILVIDDDREMADLLAQSLAQEGFDLNTAQAGEEGIELARKRAPELILLDVNLPDISGFEVLRRLRRESDVPVIMLTARGEEVDRIVGLEIGADDYLPKPFSVRELVARINAILRRTSRGRSSPPPAEETRRELKHGSVSMDLLSRTVRCDDQIVSLTTTEFELLHVLMESAGAPLRREDLSQSVLDREYSVFDRSIDNLVSALRRKLGATSEGLERIKSIRNIGYMYADLDRPRS
jgi:two-component system, OmpR family, response regulator CpxR